MSQDSSKILLDVVKYLLYQATENNPQSEELIFDTPKGKVILKLEARSGQEDQETSN